MRNWDSWPIRPGRGAGRGGHDVVLIHLDLHFDLRLHRRLRPAVAVLGQPRRELRRAAVRRQPVRAQLGLDPGQGKVLHPGAVSRLARATAAPRG